MEKRVEIDQNSLDLEKERIHLAEFMERHQGLYDRVVAVLADCIERNDLREISLHACYMGNCLDKAIKLLRIINDEDKTRAGNV